MNRLPFSPHSFALLITVAFFGLATIYSVVTPVFESPDEVWHYPFVWHLARTWELPRQDPAQPQLWQQEGSQPPLYYWLAALLTAPFTAADLPDLIYRNPHADLGRVSPDGNANIVIHTPHENWPWQGSVLAVHLARLFSILLGTGTILGVYALGRTLWPAQPRLALLAMAFVAFNPMFIFISGSVNNDNLITLLATVTIWRLVVLVSKKPFSEAAEPSLEEFVTLGMLTGLAALTKVSGLGLVGLTGLTLLMWGGRQRSWRTAILGNGLVTGFVIAIAGWWYWRNFNLYGDWTGTENMVTMMGSRAITPTPTQFLAELSGLVRSFWGVFGYFSVLLPSIIYTILNLIFLVGLLGLIVAWLFWPGEKLLPRWSTVWPILLGWLVILITGFVQWTLRTPATQGRLLFPALSIIAILWAMGWLAVIPVRWQGLPALAMLLLASWVPWGVIAPAYAPPDPLTTLPPSAQPLDMTFAEAIQLRGYEYDRASIHPGDSLSLTLYWQALKPIEIDYSVFIHLLDENDLILAQRNVFPGPGVYPTSQWTPAQLFADTYILHLPNTTFAPNQARFEVGLYHHATRVRLATTTGKDNIRFGAIEIQVDETSDLPNPQLLLFEDNILLVGYTLDRRRVAAGETVTLTLYWQAQTPPGQDYKIFVHVVGQDGTRLAQHDSDPQNGAAPTSSWASDQLISDKHPLSLAPDALPGAYQIVIGLYESQTGQRLRLLQDGSVSVQADAVTLGGIRVVTP